MRDQAAGARRGRAWSEEEDARLVEGVREGLALSELAERHGRTTGGVRARLDRFVPQSGSPVDDPLGWLRSRLAADPGYAWREVGAERRLRERRERHRGPASTEPPRAAAAGSTAEVLADWEHVTGHVLRPERREVFLARQVVHDLAAEAVAVRRSAARRLWHDGGVLLLDHWLLECVCPGAVRLTAHWPLIAERDADTVLVLRELVAAAVGEMPAERDREVLSRRLGLDDQPARTLEQVAETLGVSRERVRQLQTRAIRRLATADAPASRKLRQVLAELTCVRRVPPEAGPSAAERLLDLSDVLLPSVTPRQAIPLLARLAGADKVRADNLAAEASTIRILRHESARREATRERRVERAGRRWEALAGEITWFGNPEPAPPRAELETLREEENADRGRFGVWHCPKLDRDVSYESETELRVIQLLSLAPQIAYYQEQPLAIGYEFAGRRRTYYPDLLAATVDGRCVLIEVKPVYEMAMAVNVAKYRAAEEFCRSRGWGLVATDGNRTRRLLEHRTVDPRLETALATALDARGELTWPQVVAAADSLPLDTLGLCSLVLRHGWTWHSRPYRLRPAPPSNGPSTPPGPVVPAPGRLPG
ncbi:TnsA endonuclease N-terminal domain-containing protein [Streptomyces sp. NPDC001034]|uniref:TnsA endonuclease N-terminal domain-containing protein n=1 Tax=Streptomyces sp. NPDC001034 TaxID=3154375 RepID=UPI0033292D29